MFGANSIWAIDNRQPFKGAGVGQAVEKRGMKSVEAAVQAGGAGAAVSPDDTFAKVLQLVRTVQIGMQNIESQHGLSGSQLWALWHVSARPGLRVSDLAVAMQVRHSTASNMLDKLEQRDLIQRERQTDDTRVVRLYLTKTGQDVVRDVPGPLQGRLRNALQALPNLELIGLHRGLVSLIDTLAFE